jgi:3-dehydroquinate dehydratase
MNRIPVSIAVSTRNREEIENACRLGCDLIEIRLDLLTSPLESGMLEDLMLPPLIVTLRSRAEGGAFHGTAERWYALLQPWLERASYIDVETAYQGYAGRFRAEGKKVIASWHAAAMPSPADLDQRERTLRSYGELPKIVVAPGSPDDLLTLLSFTLHAQKPICTGIMGSRFRYGRLLLPLFGSKVVYCHAGIPTAEGQYHIEEFRAIWESMTK